MSDPPAAHFSILDGDEIAENQEHVPDSQRPALDPSSSSLATPLLDEPPVNWPSDTPSDSEDTSPDDFASATLPTSSPVTFHETRRPSSLSGRLSAITASFVAAARQGTSRVARQMEFRFGALRGNSSPTPPNRDLLPDLESMEPLTYPLTTRRVEIDADLLAYIFSFHCTTVVELVCREWHEVARTFRSVLRDLPCDLHPETALEILRRYSGLQVVKFSGVDCVTDSFLREALPILESGWAKQKQATQLVLDFSDCPRLTNKSRELLEHLAETHEGHLLCPTSHEDQEAKATSGPIINIQGCYMMAKLTPRVDGAEMVRLQVLALRHPWDLAAGMAKAFTYASPGNRAATGPLSRFSRMINQGYGIMTSATRACIYPDFSGMEEGNSWVVRFDRGSETQVFCWVLTRQEPDDEENPGCFMTSSVFPRRSTATMLDQWAHARIPVYDYTNLRLPKS